MTTRRLMLALMIIMTAAFCCACGQDSSDSKDSEKEKAKVSEEKSSKEKKETEKKDKQQTVKSSKYTKENPLVIEIDPGHGGRDGGAEGKGIGEQEGQTIYEKDPNWIIANSFKAAIEKYDNVKVFMTREGDDFISVEARVNKAAEDGANIIISFHNNSSGDGFRYRDGAMVLAGTGNLREDIAKKDQLLGAYILRELKQLGLADRGLLLRYDQEGDTYDNGKLLDFYGIVRYSMLKGISGIIIEHAYLNDKSDYSKFLSSDEKLRALGEADARGVACYYQLKPVSKETEKYNTQNIYMFGEDEEHTEYRPTTYTLHKNPQNK